MKRLEGRRAKKLVMATGKINVKRIESRGRTYFQKWLYIPAALVDSGRFPFEDNEPVLFVIDEKNNQVILQKITPKPLPP